MVVFKNVWTENVPRSFSRQRLLTDGMVDDGLVYSNFYKARTAKAPAMTRPAPLRPACGAAPPVNVEAGALDVWVTVALVAMVVVPLGKTVYVVELRATTPGAVLLAAFQVDVAPEPEPVTDAPAEAVVVVVALPQLLAPLEDCERLPDEEEPDDADDDDETAELLPVDLLLELALLETDEELPDEEEDEEELLEQLGLARTEN